MSSFHRSIRTSRITRTRTIHVDLSDTAAFPDLDGVTAKTEVVVVETDDVPVAARPWYIPDAPEPDPDAPDETVLPGWIFLTSADARKPRPKPMIDLGIESDGDEDTMPMTTTRRSPTPKPSSEPVVEWSAAEILEMFRLDVARHDRAVEERENDTCDYESEDDDFIWTHWTRKIEIENNIMYDYANEEDYDEDDEYYEYE